MREPPPNNILRIEIIALPAPFQFLVKLLDLAIAISDIAHRDCIDLEKLPGLAILPGEFTVAFPEDQFVLHKTAAKLVEIPIWIDAQKEFVQHIKMLLIVFRFFIDLLHDITAAENTLGNHINTRGNPGIIEINIQQNPFAILRGQALPDERILLAPPTPFIPGGRNMLWEFARCFSEYVALKREIGFEWRNRRRHNHWKRKRRGCPGTFEQIDHLLLYLAPETGHHTTSHVPRRNY